MICGWCGERWHRGHFCARLAKFRGRSGYALTFRYDPRHIERLKEAIPAENRRWNSTGRYWWVDAAHVKTLRRLFRKFDEALSAVELFQGAQTPPLARAPC